jgi:hypothetical protein
VRAIFTILPGSVSKCTISLLHPHRNWGSAPLLLEGVAKSASEWSWWGYQILPTPVLSAKMAPRKSSLLMAWKSHATWSAPKHFIFIKEITLWIKSELVLMCWFATIPLVCTLTNIVHTWLFLPSFCEAWCLFPYMIFTFTSLLLSVFSRYSWSILALNFSGFIDWIFFWIAVSTTKF